jgi:CRISPR-associated protein Cas1
MTLMQRDNEIPARMLNEWTYCARLGILEWVHGEFASNADTIDGEWKHRRVDKPGRDLPPPDAIADDASLQVRSLWLSSAREGLTAKMDVAEVEGGEVIPVDTKRGTLPDLPEGAWEPERVQLCAQGLILRDNGYICRRGYIYFAESRRRVEIVFDEPLVARTRELAAGFREAAQAGALPPPLVNSPKCPRCSLAGICLPDETRLLSELSSRAEEDGPDNDTGRSVTRQILAPRDDGLPLHVTTQGARIGIDGDEFVVKDGDKELGRARVRNTSQIALHGMVQMTTQAVRAALDADVPVAWFSFGGWFHGLATGVGHKNIVLRRAQFAAAENVERCLAIARELVRSKIRNQRTLLRRNHSDPPDFALRELERLAGAALTAPSPDVLLGFEGAAARLYFEHFGGMLKQADLRESFERAGRNRRPPRDPVNALLSYSYSLLAKDLAVAAQLVGLDPYLGFMHAPRYGKPALALDLMEEFRPVIADSVVVSAINNGEVDKGSFVQRADGCMLTPHGRRSFLKAYERRMDHLLTHPLFGYRATWRRIIEVQVRLLGRHLLGEAPRYTPIETR